MEHTRLHIGGKRRDAFDGGTFDAINLADELAAVAPGTVEDAMETQYISTVW